MSAAALAWAWRQPVGDYATKVVLLKLADQANDDGECWPSRRTIADDCAMSIATVKRRLRQLADEGVLEIEPRHRENGSRSSNLYRLSLNPPPGPTEPTPGSRRVTPPEPHLNLSEPNGSAQLLTKEFVDTATARGSPPTRRVIGQFAKNAKQLLDEGVAPERVRAGIGRMLDRGVVTPALLGNFVTEAGIQRAPPIRVTGWRLVRGSHGSSFVEDPDGTDIPPKGYA